MEFYEELTGSSSNYCMCDNDSCICDYDDNCHCDLDTDFDSCSWDDFDDY